MDYVIGITTSPDYPFPLANLYGYDSFLNTVLWADELTRENLPLPRGQKPWRKIIATYSNGYVVEFIFPPQ